MPSPTNIAQLLQNSHIWQASQTGICRSAMTTGYAVLDGQLHYRGWPQGAISELLLSHNGVGEIRLLMPLLVRLSQQPGYITWINPPYQPYAPALTSHKLALNKLLVVTALTTQQTIWAAQQAMSSQACSAVLVWLPQKALTGEIRKLSLAAKSGNCWGIILRSQNLHQQPSAAALRIILQPNQHQHQLSIIKQPGGWGGQQLQLDLFPERIHWSAQPVGLWPVFTATNKPTQSHSTAPAANLSQLCNPGFQSAPVGQLSSQQNSAQSLDRSSNSAARVTTKPLYH